MGSAAFCFLDGDSAGWQGMSVFELRHAKLLQEFRLSGGTVEDLARAWASADGKLAAFDAGREISVLDDETGHYAGYIVEIEEILRRAAIYARHRGGRT